MALLAPYHTDIYCRHSFIWGKQQTTKYKRVSCNC